MGAITGQKRGASVKKARHSIWNRHNQKVGIFKIKLPLAAMRKSGLVADLRQRSAKHSLGWLECQLPTQRDGWLARAANGSYPPLVPKCAWRSICYYPALAGTWPLYPTLHCGFLRADIRLLCCVIASVLTGFDVLGPSNDKGAQISLRPLFSTKPKRAVLELHLDPEIKPVALIVIQADPVVESPCT
jgi:hypothetical protein